MKTGNPHPDKMHRKRQDAKSDKKRVPLLTHKVSLQAFLINVYILLLIFSPNVKAAWFIDADIEYQYNDNQPNGDFDFDVHPDQAIESGISAGKYFQLTDSAGAGMALDLSAAQHLRFTELSHADASISAFLKKKLGLGYKAPVISTSASIAYANYRNRQRDSWRYSFGADLSKRFTERWQLIFNYLYENQWANYFIDVPFAVATVGARGNTFDLESHSLSITGAYDVNQNLSVYAGYTYRKGDVVSSTNLNIKVFRVSKAIAFDPAFGSNIVAYTVDADTNIFTAGMSWALNRNSSLNASYERRMSTAAGDLSYDNNIFQLTFLYSY